MPTYEELLKTPYILTITNKKYTLQNKNETNINNPFQSFIVDNSKLVIELSLYIGKNKIIKNILYFIYICGITKKNFTLNNYNDFKDNKIIYFG